LEATAGPKLLVVRNLMTRYAGLMSDRDCVDLIEGGILSNFMKHHIEGWEPGHREGLIHTISCYGVTAKQREQLTIGFNAVISAMTKWWTNLAQESTGIAKI
jgi:hypothetical protein